MMKTGEPESATDRQNWSK